MSAARTSSSESAGPLLGSGCSAGRSFVAGAHLVVLAGGLGGATSPVVRPCEHDRINRAIIDMGEMFTRRCWIVEIAQRDPAGQKLEFRPVIFIGRECGVAHDLISTMELMQVE